MTRTFLVDLEVGTETDMTTIAAELFDLIDQHSDFAVSSVKPWSAPKATSPFSTLPPPPL